MRKYDIGLILSAAFVALCYLSVDYSELDLNKNPGFYFLLLATILLFIGVILSNKTTKKKK